MIIVSPKQVKRPWLTIRHCRMRLNGIEEILSELIDKVNELHNHLDKIVIGGDDD